jgi:hypothetical protein
VMAAPPRDPDDFELVDFEQLKNWLRFVLHAVKRRKLLALAVALFTMGATVGPSRSYLAPTASRRSCSPRGTRSWPP